MPTDAGDVWFKAQVPSLGHDVAVTVTLARLRPDLVLSPLAVDGRRRWMLLPDGGERLREVLKRERHPRRWLELAPLYAELQLASAPAVDELLAGGAPDYRLARIPGLSEQVGAALGLAHPDPALVSALAGELAALGIAETIQHDDLHDGNVFVRPGGGYAIFDWGDSCVSHPFLSLSVLLDAVAYEFGLAPRDPDLEAIRDAYLEPWGRSGLDRAVEIAKCLGRLTRALAWARSAEEMSAAASAEPEESARANYEVFSEGVRELVR